MKKWQEILMIMAMLAGLVAQALAGWQSSDTTNYYRTNSTSAVGITEQKAISIAQQHFKGRVLAINHSDNTYRIKILSHQGTIHIVLINALDGTVISTH